MDEYKTKEEGYLIIPRAWLHEILEKQDKIISLLENRYGLDEPGIIGDYMTEEEAKRRLGRKTTWFWNLRTSGELGYAKVGKKIFYLQDDIKKLIEKNTKASTPQYRGIHR